MMPFRDGVHDGAFGLFSLFRHAIAKRGQKFFTTTYYFDAAILRRRW